MGDRWMIEKLIDQLTSAEWEVLYKVAINPVHADALKAVVVDKDMVLVAVPDCADYVDAVCIEHYEGIGGNHESAGRYWIKKPNEKGGE